MTNRVVKFLLILAAVSAGVALVGAIMGDWNGLVLIIGSAGASAVLLLIAGLVKLVGDFLPQGVSQLGRLGAISFTIGLAVWLFEAWITQGGEGRFFIPLPLIYLPLLAIGIVLSVVGVTRNRK